MLIQDDLLRIRRNHKINSQKSVEPAVLNWLDCADQNLTPSDICVSREWTVNINIEAGPRQNYSLRLFQ